MKVKARRLSSRPLLVLALFASLAFAGCQSLSRKKATLLAEGLSVGGPGKREGSVSGKVFFSPISRVWKSGFFKHCEIVEAEIRNNDYKIFDGRTPLASSEKRGWACFSRRPGQKDLLLLHADLFDHFEIPVEGEIVHKSFGRKALAILVHELAHDFWSNILDERERTLFALEGAEFLSEALLAKTKEERLSFLGRAGREKPRERDFRPYQELLNHLQNYPEEAAFGNELYSSLADLAFLGRICIPRQLKKFYCGIVSSEILG